MGSVSPCHPGAMYCQLPHFTSNGSRLRQKPLQASMDHMEDINSKNTINILQHNGSWTHWRVINLKRSIDIFNAMGHRPIGGSSMIEKNSNYNHF